ncbi:hypothetical protein FGRMN_6855 [Fusarium graminum]|nr:hypothetical protein FGRMN_6855 [Fusarium graminum]
MEALDGYDPQIFESINYLRDAERNFFINNGPSARAGPIRNLFIKHGVADSLGLILLHKHFNLNKGQALVDYNGTAMAWDLEDTTVSECGLLQKHGGLIKPRAWLLSPTKNKLIPYEFYFQHLKAIDKPAYKQTPSAKFTVDFVNEFAEIVTRDKLSNVLGVCLLKSPLKTEIETSEGCANISMSVVDDGTFNSSNSIEAIWNYVAEETGGDIPNKEFTSEYRCTYYCIPSNQTHISGGHI